MASEQDIENDLEAKIRDRAYKIWLDEGQPHGQDLEHWAQAEQEIVKGTGVAEKVEAPKKAVSNGKAGKR